jgi:hypothetical protein
MPIDPTTIISITCRECSYSRTFGAAINLAHDWAIRHNMRRGHAIEVRALRSEVIHTYQRPCQDNFLFDD